MTSGIIHDDDIARLENGNQLLLDTGKKALAIDRSVEDTRGCHAIAPQRAEECQRAPVAVWCKGPQALAFWSPAPDGRHVGLDPGLINEDEAFRIEMLLQCLPSPSPAGDVDTGLLKGE